MDDVYTFLIVLIIGALLLILIGYQLGINYGQCKQEKSKNIFVNLKNQNINLIFKSDDEMLGWSEKMMPEELLELIEKERKFIKYNEPPKEIKK